MKRIYLIWGGLVGWDGILTSAGLVGLESQLSKHGPVKSYMQSSYLRCVSDIYRECEKDDICVLGGYSGGGIQALRASVILAKKRIPQQIDLFINIDTSPQYNIDRPDTHPLSNIKRILNIYNPYAFALGGGLVKSSKIPSDDYPMRIGHLSFQFNQEVRNIIDRKVASL